MENEMLNGQEAPVDLEGIDPRFHGVVRTHGRALWVLVFNANMANEALKVVQAQAHKHSSGSLQRAAAVLGHVLLEQGNAYCQSAGWSQEQIDACSRAIMLAAQESGRIQLLN